MRKYAGVLLITNENALIVQLRDNKPEITNPGMITLFGGAIEEGESELEGALREILEETNLKISLDDIVPFTVVSKIEDDGSETQVHVFKAENIKTEGLEIYEGQGYVVIEKETDLSTINISDTARKIVEMFFA